MKQPVGSSSTSSLHNKKAPALGQFPITDQISRFIGPPMLLHFPGCLIFNTRPFGEAFGPGLVRLPYRERPCKEISSNSVLPVFASTNPRSRGIATDVTLLITYPILPIAMPPQFLTPARFIGIVHQPLRSHSDSRTSPEFIFVVVLPHVEQAPAVRHPINTDMNRKTIGSCGCVSLKG